MLNSKKKSREFFRHEAKIDILYSKKRVPSPQRTTQPELHKVQFEVRFDIPLLVLCPLQDLVAARRRSLIDSLLYLRKEQIVLQFAPIHCALERL